MKPETRRTGDELLDAIATAVLKELQDEGYHGVTFEGVARRAETSKPVLYRRWAARPEMVFFAITRMAQPQLSQPLQPTLRENLRTIGKILRAGFDEYRVETTLGLMAEATPELRAKFTSYELSPALCHIRSSLELAHEQGEIPEPVELFRLHRMAIQVFVGEFIAQGSCSDETIDAIVDDTLLPIYGAK
ncbi:TetR/AcrR family transcriptional regulator [Corynebacterium sp. H113]|uniref:TetR/AcrR family transcriptional regulator n=1 Tax=Corynebacterium sp. H113 TaxID=3133419 RepID=UPI0030B47D75